MTFQEKFGVSQEGLFFLMDASDPRGLLGSSAGVFDLSKSGNHLLVTGGTRPNIVPVDSFGVAWNFNSRHIRKTGIPNTPTRSPLTFSIWLKSNAGTGVQHFFVCESATGRFNLSIDDATNIMFFESFNTAPFSALLRDGNWHHVCFTFVGVAQVASPLYLYIDSKLVQTNSINIASTMDSISVGATTNGAQSIANSYIANFMIFTRCLTQAEVYKLYINYPKSIIFPK